MVTEREKKKVIQPVFIVITWHDCLVAGHTLGRKFIAVAVAAHQPFVLAGEGFVCQRALAAETAEAVLVVVSVLVEELLEEEMMSKMFHKEISLKKLFSSS